jgi:predicted  nucleic acid-binding Zn-ribbon protein
MKAIFYAVAILVAGAAAYFSYDHSQKFLALETDRLLTIKTNTETTASATATESENTKLRGEIAKAEERRELLKQSVSSLKSIGAGLEGDIARLETDLKAQAQEFADLQKALDEVNLILESLGGGVTLETLPEKIEQIAADKTAKQTKLEELETLVGGAEKNLATSRAESDRLTKRMIDRSTRISRNAMEAVITAVNQDWGFLVIGAGSNSGFTPQTTLIVQRDGRQIGRVRPSSIEPTQTIAEIDFNSLVSGVRLQPGDRVILAKPTSN